MSAVDVQIRRTTPTDISAIRTIHVDAFPTDAEAALVEQLQANERLTASLIAEKAGIIVGHIAFSPVQDEAGTQTGLGLAPVAVSPSHQRQGIGEKLIEAGLEACREMGADYVVLLGDPAYYNRFGFTPASQHGLTCEYTDGDAFQVIELRDGALQNVTGLIRYADEFNAL